MAYFARQGVEASFDFHGNNVSPPKFSVITVSYNQAEYLPDNIESVLAQNYPEFEHIIVDGGSEDHSRDVCERYEHVQFVLAAGTTQAEALNIGFRMATGEIIAWLNSDDYYERETFARVAEEISPERNRWVVSGAANVVDERGQRMWILPNGRVPFRRLLYHPRLYPHNGWTVMPCQPAVFFHRRVLDQAGLLSPKLKYAMDYEYWLRILRKGFHFHYVPQVFAAYRHHSTSLTSRGYDTFLDEWKQVSHMYLQQLRPVHRLALACWWAYARVECAIVWRHKAALQYVAKCLQPRSSSPSRMERIRVLMRSMLIAPWTPLSILWQTLYRHCSPIYRQTPWIPPGQNV